MHKIISLFILMTWVSIEFYFRANSFRVFVENKNVQYLLLFFIIKVDRVRITRLFCLFICTYIGGVCQVYLCCEGGGDDKGDYSPVRGNYDLKSAFKSINKIP